MHHSFLRPFAAFASVALLLALGVYLGRTVLGPGSSGAPHAAAGAPPVAPAQRATARELATFATKTPEMHTVSITPCRIANTLIKGGAIPRGGYRNYQVTGTTGFSNQGGTSTGCGIPAGAVSVQVSISAFKTQGSGQLVAYATGTARPIVRTVSITKGVESTVSAEVRVGSHGQMSVYDGSSGTVYVVLDVISYQVPQIQGLIYTGPNPYIYSGSARILSVTHIATGVVDVTIDRDVSLCTATVTAFYDKYYYADAKNQGANQIRIYSWYLSSTTATTTPIYIDNDVYLNVAC